MWKLRRGSGVDVVGDWTGVRFSNNIVHCARKINIITIMIFFFPEPCVAVI